METMSPPLLVQAPPLESRRLRVGPVLRDVAIIWALTTFGGFVIGIAAGSGPRNHAALMAAIGISNILMGTISFTISGCLAPPGRWRHLAMVALGSWLTSFANVLLFGVGVGQWITGAFFIALMMTLGGVISYIFKRDHAL